MAGMRPFIPAKDLAYFEHFVEHIDVTADSVINYTATQSPHSYRSDISTDVVALVVVAVIV